MTNLDEHRDNEVVEEGLFEDGDVVSLKLEGGTVMATVLDQVEDKGYLLEGYKVRYFRNGHTQEEVVPPERIEGYW